jgi:hypothetical protein
VASRKTKSKRNRDAKRQTRGSWHLPSRSAVAKRSSRHLHLQQLKPCPLPDEAIEDLAVFAGASREQLAPERQAEAAAVGEALELVSAGEFAPALERLKVISRASPLADWRLFVRGLVAFYQRDLAAARESWARLDRTRRPARIATTLLTAEVGEPLDTDFSQPPEDLVDAAREMLLRPTAIAAARQIAGIEHYSPEETFSLEQLGMLKDFRDEYGTLDPVLVDRFSQACVRLSYFQPDSFTFDVLTALLPGPPHDPRWHLFSALYCSQFQDASDEVLNHCDLYQKDLQQLTSLGEDLRAALASELCLFCARTLLNRVPQSQFVFFYSGPDFTEAETLARQATKHYPRNRAAHQLLISTLVLQLRNRRLTKSAEAEIENRLTVAKTAFVTAFTNELELTLELIDHHLDHDQLEAADVLVRQLGSQRLDDPLAKALPWKLKLREAMRMSRNKSQLSQVGPALDAAESLWPSWLQKDWLPFLRAAAELRLGNQAEFERLNAAARQAVGGSQLLGDVMEFAALQQMNLPSVKLNSLRARIDDHAKQAGELPMSELLRLGVFFWDLTRTGMRYRGYRLHGKKFGKPLCDRLHVEHHGQAKLAHDKSTLLGALGWLASHGFWTNGYELKPPAWTEQLVGTDARAAVEILDWIVRSRFSGYHLRQMQAEMDMVEQAARTEIDPFYRYRLATVAKQARDSLAEAESQRAEWESRFNVDLSALLDDDDDDDDDDEPCNCPSCRAARAREAAARAEPRSGGRRRKRRQGERRSLDRDDDERMWFADEGEDDEFAGPDPDVADGMPPIAYKVITRLGPQGIKEFFRIVGSMGPEAEGESDPSVVFRALFQLFSKYGLSARDLTEFFMMRVPNAERSGFERTGTPDDDFVDDPSDEWPTAPPSGTATTSWPMSADERREQMRQRRKRLERIKKQRGKNRR